MSEEQPQQVTVTFPADTRFVALARASAASLAADLDFSIDEVEELRIAVDEIVTLLIDAQPGDGMLSLVFTVYERGFRVDASVAEPRKSVSPDDLTRQILAAVVDEFDIGDRLCSIRVQRAEQSG